MVECQLPKLDVAGSIPVSRSTQQGVTRSQSNVVTSHSLFDLVMRSGFQYYSEYNIVFCAKQQFLSLVDRLQPNAVEGHLVAGRMVLYRVEKQETTGDAADE